MSKYKYLESYPMWRPSHRSTMRRIMKKSNIPQNLWKYYIDAPELWDETEVYDGIRSILMMNSYQNIVPWWMLNATIDDLVRLKLKFTSIVREREEFARFANMNRTQNHGTLMRGVFAPKQRI